MIGVLLNPNAGKGKPVKFKDKVKSIVVKLGYTPLFKCTKFRGHEKEIIEEFIEKGVKTIIIMGGDGTINESLRALIGKSTKILPLPMGSGDDYIRSIYGTTDIQTILNKLGKNEWETFPVGEVKAGNEKFYFINGMGIGFDAEVLVNMEKFPFLKGPLQYLMSIISTIFFYKASEISFVSGDTVDKRRILLVTIGLGKFLGGGFMLLPKANPLKWKFDTSIVDEVNKLIFFRLLPSAKNGNHLTSKYVKYIEGLKSLVIRSKKMIKFHLDGELMPVKYREIEVSIKNEGVRIVI
ncbi:MAG: hypothetical protein GWP03_05525 [Proteobacteria bacterium]|nr:hypothetical protein [Pseudomonadota bacterium]